MQSLMWAFDVDGLLKDEPTQATALRSSQPSYVDMTSFLHKQQKDKGGGLQESGNMSLILQLFEDGVVAAMVIGGSQQSWSTTNLKALLVYYGCIGEGRVGCCCSGWTKTNCISTARVGWCVKRAVKQVGLLRVAQNVLLPTFVVLMSTPDKMVVGAGIELSGELDVADHTEQTHE
eukprot:3917609-Amphidinium_carterae.7